MRKILVVCGAGASSTFLVHWMRRVAQSRSLDLVIDAGSQDDLAGRIGDVAAVLVGAHLAEQFASLRAQAASTGVPAALLPTLAFDAAGAATALDLLEELLTAHDTGSSRG